MYTDFHDQNHNSLSPSVVMPAVKNHIIRHSGGFELFRPNGQTPFAYFGEDDYIRESFVLTNSCGSDGIKLGSVNIGMMKVTVKNENVARIQSPDMLIDCVAYVSFNLTVDDNTTADVRYGAYFVKEVEQLTEGVKLTCYDGMCKLDAPFSGALSGTPYQILTAAATACGVRVQSTQAEIEALPNGTKTFTLHEDNDCKTWRDVLAYLTALMGCFVTFGRLTYGAMTLPGIEVRPFGGGASSFCDTITDTQRYTGAKFSLWDTAYAEFTLKAYALEDPNDPDSAKKQDFTYTDTTISTEGQTIDLGYNPFLQATTPETGLTQDQISILHDLLDKVATYQYTPLQITLPVGFIYDLGDVLKCTGRLANTGFAGGPVDDAYGVILNETYTYGRDYRIKSLDSHAGKGRTIASTPITATLNVTVTGGTGSATITATDGVHTYTTTEISGSATLTIGASGAYRVTATLNGRVGSITDSVAITIDGGIYTATVGFNAIGFTARSDSIVTAGGVTISTNNGNRTPVIKENAGKAAGIFSTDFEMHPDTPTPGWIGVALISTDENAVKIDCPNISHNVSSVVIDGATIYYDSMSTNSTWGGGTTFTNPLGLPVVNYPIHQLNYGITEAQMRQIMTELQFQVIWQ